MTSEQGSVVMEAGAGLVLDTVNWNHINCGFYFYIMLNIFLSSGDAPSRRGPGLLRGGGAVQALRLPSLGARVQGEREERGRMCLIQRKSFKGGCPR